MNELKRGESQSTLSEMIWCCWEYYASIPDHTLVNHLVLEQIVKCYLIEIPKEIIDVIVRMIVREWDTTFCKVAGTIVNYYAQGDTLIVIVNQMEYNNASGY